MVGKKDIGFDTLTVQRAHIERIPVARVSRGRLRVHHCISFLEEEDAGAGGIGGANPGDSSDSSDSDSDSEDDKKLPA